MNLEQLIYARATINGQLTPDSYLGGTQQVLLKTLPISIARLLADTQMDSRSFRSLELQVSKSPILESMGDHTQQIFDALVADSDPEGIDDPLPDYPQMTFAELITLRLNQQFKRVEDSVRAGIKLESLQLEMRAFYQDYSIDSQLRDKAHHFLFWLSENHKPK